MNELMFNPNLNYIAHVFEQLYVICDSKIEQLFSVCLEE